LLLNAALAAVDSVIYASTVLATESLRMI